MQNIEKKILLSRVNDVFCLNFFKKVIYKLLLLYYLNFSER